MVKHFVRQLVSMRSVPFVLASAAFGALAAEPARAQAALYVVDDSGGPGVHFTSIVDAVAAAVDGDRILVRPGSYGPFTLSEDLTLIGDPGVAVQPGTLITAVAGAAGARIVGLSFRDLTISGCSSPVLLDGTEVGPSPVPFSAFDPVLEVEASADVRFHRGTIRGGDGWVAGEYGQIAARVRSSRVEFASCTLRGGDGRDHDYIGWYLDGGHGGDGLRVDVGSRVHLALSDVQGGVGGTGCSALCSGVGGDGGHGVELDGGSDMVVAGTQANLVKGAKGGYALHPGSTGRGVVVRAGTTLRYSSVQFASGNNLPGILEQGLAVRAIPPDPTLERLGTPLPGAPLTFRLHANPLTIGRLQQGNRALVVDDGLDALERLNNRIRLHPMGPLTSNSLDLTMPVPPGAPPGWFRVFQGLEIEGGDLAGRTNSVPVIVR